MSEKRFKKWMILPLAAIFTFCLTEIAAKQANWIEVFYAQKFYPVIASTISFFSDLFPFSLDDIFYTFLILGLTILFLFLISRKVSFKTTGKIILNTVATIYISFYLLWGFNYYRENLNIRLSLTEKEPNTEKFIQQFRTLIESTNHSYSSLSEINKEEIDSLIETSYKEYAPALKLKYPGGKRKDKTITLSRFFAMAGISGYYGPFFNEVHVNSKILALEYPFVLAHEKAHQFGITSEAEANFYAWLVCTKSDSKLLQYSANLHILRFFIYQAYQLEEYSELISKLDESVKTDFKKIRTNWMLLRNEQVNKVASKVNDTYLKTNKVEKGIEDYRGVVKFVMDFSQDTAFQEKFTSTKY